MNFIKMHFVGITMQSLLYIQRGSFLHKSENDEVDSLTISAYLSLSFISVKPDEQSATLLLCAKFTVCFRTFLVKCTMHIIRQSIAYYTWHIYQILASPHIKSPSDAKESQGALGLIPCSCH